MHWGAEQYRAVSEWFRARPRAEKALRLTSKGAVAAVYLCYIGLLAALLLGRDERFWRVFFVPLAVFCVGTALRALLNLPRPYEVLEFTPLRRKDEPGKSFPSRHSFCAAGIAVTALWAVPPLGIFLCVVAVAVALCRVLQGVHWPQDVLAGLVFGAVMAAVGCFVL